jgi:Protein kinase domain/Lanthionine synthetase C-like protein
VSAARFVLPPDVAFVPVEALPPDRRRFTWERGDVAITRARTRVASRVVASDAAQLLREFRSPSTIVDAVLRFSRTRGADPEATLTDSYPLVASLVNSGVLVREGESREIQASLAPGDSFRGWTVVATVQVLDDTELYLVRRDGRYAALKIGRRDFAHEAAVASDLIESGEHFLLTAWHRGVDALVAAQTDDVLPLCASIAYAFAELHERGVVHGDVHPRNILVERDGTVRLIDFGQARVRDVAPPRAGIAFYFEPELAAALRTNAPAPMPSEAGEQYAVAAMLWSLVAGDHYLDYSIERAELLRQIAEDGPRPMRAPWGPLEDVLRVALQKEPARRYPSMRQFANALADLTIAPRRAPSVDLIERLTEHSAFFRYRLACERGDAELLALADAASFPCVDAFDFTIHALIAAARGDERTTSAAIREFVRCAPVTAESLRCATVLLDFEPSLREFGDALQHRLWPSAHWSVAQASLAWSLATVEPPDPRALAALERFRAEAIPTGRGARWPWNGSDSLAGVCNGSAGFVHLWLTAHEALGDPADLALAIDAAWHTWETRDDEPSLCCGPAARAHALVAIDRATGDRAWRERAQSLAAHVIPDARGMRALVVAALGDQVAGGGSIGAVSAS